MQQLERNTHQVQMGGVPCRQGEIESVLDRHPLVREAVVVAQESGSGDRRLVAYLVPTNDQRPTTSTDPDFPVTLSPCHLVTLSRYSSLVTQLRDYLKQTLPEY